MLTNSKKAQISMFIVIALVLVIAGFGTYYYLNSRTGVSSDSAADFTGSTQTMESNRQALSGMVKNCLEEETKSAVELYGIGENQNIKIAGYIEDNIAGCVDTSYFETKGFGVEMGQPTPTVKITDDAIIATLTYPIELSFKGESARLDSFEFNLQRTTSVELPLGSDGATLEEVRFMTEDGNAEVIIPAGTKATLEDGTPAGRISFRMLDRNFDDLSNGVLIGKISYEGEPDGVQFEPAITVKIKYQAGEIPSGLEEDADISMAWYDSERGFWRSVPTTIDTENKLLISTVSHFSHLEVANCPENIDVASVHDYGRIFEQECGDVATCMSATWDGLHEQETQYVPDIQELNSFDSGTLVSRTACVLKDWDQDDQSDDCPGDCSCSPDYSGLGASIRKFVSNDAYSGCSCVANNGVLDEEGCDCDCNGATYMTYGYEDALRGTAELPFYIRGGGDSCIRESPGELASRGDELADITVELECSPGDECTYTALSPEDMHYGWNSVEVSLANGDDNGCLWAGARIIINGIGIGFAASDCTDFDGNSPYVASGAYGRYSEEEPQVSVSDICTVQDGKSYVLDNICLGGYLVQSYTQCDGGCKDGACLPSDIQQCSIYSDVNDCDEDEVCIASHNSLGSCYPIADSEEGSFETYYVCHDTEDDSSCVNEAIAYLKEEFGGGRDISLVQNSANSKCYHDTYGGGSSPKLICSFELI